MLKTPHTTTWEISLEIFNFTFRPCRHAQETIYEYQMDGRPQFEWEYLRQLWIFNNNPAILDFCGDCPINIMAEVEGCKTPVENLDIFFRAIDELSPDSAWARIPRDGTPVPAHEIGTLLAELLMLRDRFADLSWPSAVPKEKGSAYYEPVEQETDTGEFIEVDGPLQFYAWNGEGPPGLLYLNEGYTIYLSRHGLLVKPAGQDPVPYVFRRLWREDLGVFGEDSQGEQVGFDVLAGRYPTWGFSTESDTELVFEALPASQVFIEIFDLLEVFCGIAHEYETGILVKAPLY